MALSPRKIGTSSVPPVGFGSMGLSAFYGSTGSDEERFKILDAAYEAGCTHWDTADVYGDSEELIGKWFKRTGKRDEIFLATKFAFSSAGIRGDAEFVQQQIDTSLKRLGVDYVDLYYQHRPDTKTPIETTVKAMAELVKQGKVKNLGLSECTAKDLRRAHAVHPIAAYQIEYSPFFLDIESDKTDLLKTAKELGITIVAYSPLGRGLLTGRYKSPADFEKDDCRHDFPRFSKENFPYILGIVDKLSEIGKAHNATAGQVTLAWLLAQSDNVVVIPGTKNVKYLLENIGSAKLQLSKEEVAAVRSVADEAEKIPGGRYDDYMITLSLVETPSL